jgi:hypothetical protein
MISLLVYERSKVSAEYLQEFFKPNFSPAGGNQRAIEEVIVFNWVTFIQDTAGMYMLHDTSPMEVGRKSWRGPGMKRFVHRISTLSLAIPCGSLSNTVLAQI